MDSDPTLRAQLADEQIEIMLLRDEFADLHFGTINHCLWDVEQAECQNGLPEDQRGKAPVLGRLPAREVPELGDLQGEARADLDRRGSCCADAPRQASGQTTPRGPPEPSGRSPANH